MGASLTFDFCIDLNLLVCLQPLSFLLQSLLKENVLFAVLVDVLEEVNSSLILAAPLLLASVPLLFVLLLGKLVNHAFIGRLV